MNEKENALVRNAADPEQVKGAKNAERRRRERELEDTRFVLHDPRGRRFLARLIEFCKSEDVCYVHGGREAERQTTFNLGMRNVGQFLKVELEAADLSSLQKMTSENKEKE